MDSLSRHVLIYQSVDKRRVDCESDRAEKLFSSEVVSGDWWSYKGVNFGFSVYNFDLYETSFYCPFWQ